ncbi:hypothetical protein MYCGRDRAFT_33888 [Paecilomyces variotii No. 5]|uniref:Alpha/beta hydrolase fold-3 domain-containing protein n=1 Tax=Byssochlamys spectabilis (strain No. 5 / NBRC 109023) TaxID=1356009 RepID=V5HW31_BYSSN|nr:hypothetical protein MYCGRDRAFT_33888 [Paecilomyces variotii No. 5]
MDPEFEKALLSHKPQPLLGDNLLEQRERYNAARVASNNATSIEQPSQVEAITREIPVRDGSGILVRIYRPKCSEDEADTRALCVMFHGGGWCFGGLENEDVTCRRISESLGIIVINVDYRLAPEHKFPTGIQDAYDAVKWVAANSPSLKADPKKGFIIGGASAGANYAAAICLALRNVSFYPSITGCFLDTPVVVHPTAVPKRFEKVYQSYVKNKDSPILSQKQLEIFFNLYNGEPTSPWFSPLVHPNGHRGLPPTCFKACGLDPLLDDALIYERVLREEGEVVTKLSVYPGVPHSFNSAFPDLEVSRKWNAETIEGVSWLLGLSTA